MGTHRDDSDTRFPGLLDAVLSAADSDDVCANVGLADNAPVPCNPSTRDIDGE
jgi:hypothetical protein